MSSNVDVETIWTGTIRGMSGRMLASGLVEYFNGAIWLPASAYDVAKLASVLGKAFETERTAHQQTREEMRLFGLDYGVECKRADAAERRLAAANALLTCYEWISDHTGRYYAGPWCPGCTSERKKGHSQNCKLAAYLRGGVPARPTLQSARCPKCNDEDFVMEQGCLACGWALSDQLGDARELVPAQRQPASDQQHHHPECERHINQAAQARVEELKRGASRENDDICQTLGIALHYPRFCDDQVNFPGTTEANGVCVGDHVAASMATEAARRIGNLERRIEELTALVESAYREAHGTAVRHSASTTPHPDIAWLNSDARKALFASAEGKAGEWLLAMKPASDEEMRVHMSSRGVASWALDTDNWPSVAAAYRACERRLLPFDDEYEE